MPRTLTGADEILLFALAAFVAVSALHCIYGYRIYVLGVRMPDLWGDDDWTPTTPRQRLLLGVFFVAAVAWLQTVAVTGWAILSHAPGRAWVGVAGAASNLAQAGLLLRFVGITPLGRILLAAYLLQIGAFVYWTVEAGR